MSSVLTYYVRTEQVEDSKKDAHVHGSFLRSVFNITPVLTDMCQVYDQVSKFSSQIKLILHVSYTSIKFVFAKLTRCTEFDSKDFKQT